jgi:hypothetical protein
LQPFSPTRLLPADATCIAITGCFQSTLPRKE